VGRNREAIAHYQRALGIRPDYYDARINFAKLLMRLDRGQGGDPSLAVTTVQGACESTGHREAACLETLAGAYAAANRFDEAVRTAQDAMELARSAGDTALVQRLVAAVTLYRQKTNGPPQK
jgi:tetratricopeptide (TPR) repeat protein